VAITPDQLKAARAQLDWSQDDVAGVDILTILKFENGKSTPNRDVLNDIRIALQAAGADLPQKANLPP
jgi:transcriptional regulator with XRE-family HTH domain